MKNTNGLSNFGILITSSYIANATPGYSNSSSTLPIELLSFTAQYKNEKIAIQWQTATEYNNAYFTLERSIDADVFTAIANIQGAGNSNQIQTYQYEDKDMNLNSTIYYRLRQTDFDGTFSYSKIISLNTQEVDFQLSKSYYVDGNLYCTIVSSKHQKAQIEIFDLNGKRIFNESIGIVEGLFAYRINLPIYAKGIYIIHICNTESLSVRDKLMLK